MVDLRLMRQFVAVAEELHFGRAAKRLNMAQPPLSQSIRRLEASLGVELFDRSRRSVELTPAGAVFLVESRRTLAQAEVARKMAQRTAAIVPEIRVSFIGPALYQLLPGLIASYRVAAPEVQVRLYEEPSPVQIRGILAADYDVGFVTAGLRDTAHCQTLLVERSPFVAAVPADSALGTRETITLVELADHPFILPPQHYAAGSETLSIFKAVGVIPDVTQEASQTNTTLSLVGAGLGCSIVMAPARLSQARNVHFIDIADGPPSVRWEMAMAWERDRPTGHTRDFIRFATDYVRDRPDLIEPDPAT